MAAAFAALKESLSSTISAKRVPVVCGESDSPPTSTSGMTLLLITIHPISNDSLRPPLFFSMLHLVERTDLGKAVLLLPDDNVSAHRPLVDFSSQTKTHIEIRSGAPHHA